MIQFHPFILTIMLMFIAPFEIGEKATNEFESVRLKIKKFLNVPDSHEVIFEVRQSQ